MNKETTSGRRAIGAGAQSDRMPAVMDRVGGLLEETKVGGAVASPASFVCGDAVVSALISRVVRLFAMARQHRGVVFGTLLRRAYTLQVEVRRLQRAQGVAVANQFRLDPYADPTAIISDERRVA